MDSIEKVWRNIFQSPGVWAKILVGTCLSLIPVLHFFALGYIYRFTLQIRQGYRIELPEWDNWKDLFLDGLKFFLLLLVWLGIPLLIGHFIKLVVGVVTDDFGQLAFMLSIPFGFALAGASLFRFQTFESFKDALDLTKIMRMYILTFKFGLVPLLAACGIFWLTGMLSIFLLFTIGLLIFAYFTSLFRALEKGFL